MLADDARVSDGSAHAAEALDRITLDEFDVEDLRLRRDLLTGRFFQHYGLGTNGADRGGLGEIRVVPPGFSEPLMSSARS